MAQIGPAVDCSKAASLLSDFLDVRRGERPTPMESPLGNPRVLQALEEHLAHCEACKQELHALDELGLAFAEFNLNEPEADHFEGYGRMVRERVRRMTQRTVIGPGVNTASPWRTWISTVAASAAAAVLTVVLLGSRDAATTPKAVSPEPPVVAQGTDTQRTSVDIPATPDDGLRGSLVEAAEAIDVPTLEPRSLDLNLLTGSGSRRVTFDPRAEKQNPMVDLAERSGPFVLGDPPADASQSSGLVGIMFRATGDEDPAEGLSVVAVKRGGPADAAGLKPDDRLLAVNGISFSASSSTEVVKFFNAVSNLGSGKLIQVDYARKKGNDWLIKRGKAVLGTFQ